MSARSGVEQQLLAAEGVERMKLVGGGKKPPRR